MKKLADEDYDEEEAPELKPNLDFDEVENEFN